MKKYLLLTTILLVAIFSILPMISADVVTPVTGFNYTTTTELNCSYTNGSEVTDPTTAVSNWTYNVSGVDTAIAHTGFVCGTNYCTATADLTLLTDGIYTVKCIMANATTMNMSAVNSTSVMFDSTDPVCSSEEGHDTLPWKGIQQIDWTSSDLIELLTTATTIDRPEDAADITYTDANKEVTLTSQDTKYIGGWTFGLLATDRAGNIGTCNESWKTYLPNGEVGEGEEPSKIPGWLIVVIIIGIIYFISKKK